ncbi:MAG: hypothetical protein KJO85_10730, partial [Gammaproteobacteria bacterium]|nr:hypothetical protein [Gammaproteobacteria bacterium]
MFKHRWHKIAIASLFLACSSPAISLDAKQWHEDLDYLAQHLATKHANPWDRVHQRAFVENITGLKGRIHELSDAEITIELMRLAASFKDGHTKLLPTGDAGFSRWFPLRFHQFKDGIYLTSIPADATHLRGKRVVTINGHDAQLVRQQVTALFGADNRFGRNSFAFLMSNADLLKGLGMVGPETRLELQLVDVEGNITEWSTADLHENTGMDFRFWGEYFGPAETDSISAYGGEALNFLTTRDPGRPLHLRKRNAYNWEWLEQENTVYFQLNAMSEQSSQSDQSLFETWDEALAKSRSTPGGADRFILDLRYNFGGDGSLSHRLVSEFIRGYPGALEQGRVFVITGGATFSAGVMLAEEMLNHVPALLVGEPMGAPYNMYGDAEAFFLPNSGYQVDISRRYWQLSLSDDFNSFIPVQIPAALTGAEYFSDKDPAVDQILAAPVPYPALDLILYAHG